MAKVLRICVTIVFCLLFAGGMLYSRVSVSGSAGEAADPPTDSANAAVQRRYSVFKHDTKAHQRACTTCHQFPTANWKSVRTGDAAFPDVTDYPKHQSCIGCHRQQFFRGSPPAICSICHVNPGPRNSARHPFPNPREIFDKSRKGQTHIADFGIYFPHAIHVEIVSEFRPGTPRFEAASWPRRQDSETSCAVCHQTYMPAGDSPDEYLIPPPKDLGDAFWVKKGMFKTKPIDHATCFTCHSADSGMSPAPTDCATCHKPRQDPKVVDYDPNHPAAKALKDKIARDAWRLRDSSATYRHEFFAHAELACSTCHNVSAMNTADPATKRVGLTSCAMCHATPTTDDGGALNYEMEARKADPSFKCVKCHISFGSKPAPESHIKILSEATGQ